MTSPTPYSSDESTWLDPPGFLAEDSGGVSTSSPWLDLGVSSTTYSNPTWLGDVSGTSSSLSMPWIESAPEPLTYGLSEFASPIDASNDSSGKPNYKERIDFKNHHHQLILSCVPAGVADSSSLRKGTRPQHLAWSDDLRRPTCTECSLSHVACRSVNPANLEVRISISRT